MPTAGGISYVRWNFIVLDVAVLLLIAGVAWLFFASSATVGWVLIALGGLTLLIVVPTYATEFRWRRHHDAAMVAYQQGDYGRAERHFRESADCARKFGPNDNRLAQALNNLAAIYESTNRGSEAVQMYKEALAIYERASGPAPSRAAEVRQNLQRLALKQS